MKIMKQPVNILFLLVFAILTFSACEKNNPSISKDAVVEIYQIEFFSTIDKSCQIDERKVELAESPLVAYNDILSYDSINHTFELSDNGKERIIQLNLKVNGLPFAVKANNTLIYTAYFWPGYSSSSCMWIVADPIYLYSSNLLPIRLGYPGLFPGAKIEDKRNDPRIIEIFERDGKLRS
jgi:hypothetical protein